MMQEEQMVYDYLERDYTPNAEKTDVFVGDHLHIHRMQNPCGKIISCDGNES